MFEKDRGPVTSVAGGYFKVTNGDPVVKQLLKRSTMLAASLVLMSPLQLFADDGAVHQDQSGKTAQPMCPVMGDEVANLAISTRTDDGPVFFCCDDCISKFQKDPAKYATKAKAQRMALAGHPRVQITCPVSGDTVDRKVFVERDGDKVYFCCSACVTKFEGDSKKYAANLANSYTYQTKCPVMGNTVDPASFTKLADGRKIYYCCDGCEGKLFGTPAKYAKNLSTQGFQYNWSKIKKADARAEAPHGSSDGHEGHDHGGHEHP